MYPNAQNTSITNVTVTIAEILILRTLFLLTPRYSFPEPASSEMHAQFSGRKFLLTHGTLQHLSWPAHLLFLCHDYFVSQNRQAVQDFIA